ncbi:MAG: MarR family transcriptional regulator [Planctomycetota bacterium]
MVTPNAKNSRTAVHGASDERNQLAGLDELSFYVARVYYNFLALLERSLVEAELDEHLRPGMGLILQALYEKDNLIIKEIAQFTRLSHSTLTGMLDKMEKAGIVKRAADPSDGRAVRIRLTALGKSLEQRFARMNKRLNAVLAAGLSEDDVRNAKHLVSRMIENMKTIEKTAPVESARGKSTTS